MNRKIQNLIDRTNSVLIKLSYAVAKDASFRKTNRIINKYYSVCSELENASQEDIDLLITKSKSSDPMDLELSEYARSFLIQIPSERVIMELVEMTNDEDMNVSFQAGVALLSLKSAPKNMEALLAGANKTDSYGQLNLKNACIKWSTEEHVEEIKKLLAEETDPEFKCIL